MRNTRGQAAMEFLMTYGWAILAAIIAIGVLAYFGVFSPSRYISETSYISAPLGSAAVKVNTTGIYLQVENGVGDNILIENLSISGCGGAMIDGPGNLVAPTTGIAMSSGTTAVIGFKCTAALTSGSNFRGDILVVFNKSTSNIDLQSTGSVTAKVRTA